MDQGLGAGEVDRIGSPQSGPNFLALVLTRIYTFCPNWGTALGFVQQLLFFLQAERNLEDSKPSDGAQGSKNRASELRWSALGFEFALGVLVLGALGFAVDRHFPLTEEFPVFLVLGLLLGFVWATWRLQRQIFPPSQDSAPDDSDSSS